MARAAATFRWRGSTSSAWDVPGNWIALDGTTWSAAYPGYDVSAGANVDGDTVMLDAAAINALAGYDATAKGDLQSVKVTSAYCKADGTALDVGSNSSYLRFDMTTTGEVIIEGTAAGNLYLKGVGTRGLTEVTLQGTRRGSRLYLDGSIGTLSCFKGDASVLGTATIGTALRTGYMAAQLTDVNLTIAAGATLPASIDVNGGTITSSAAVTAVRMSGGLWTQSANMTSVSIWGGKIVWLSGTITTLDVWGGDVDASQSVTPRTLGTARVFYGGALNLNDNVKSVSVTNPIELQGGGITLCPDTKISLS